MGDEVTDVELKLLAEQCTKAKDFAHVPYSHFRVGAAVLSAKEGKIFSGALSSTLCTSHTAGHKACVDYVAISQAT